MITQSFSNTFSKGIDRDTSVNKYSNDTYYDAQDLRIITKDTLSNGALTNVDGNTSIIKFRDKIAKVFSSVVLGSDLYLFVYFAPYATLEQNVSPLTEEGQCDVEIGDYLVEFVSTDSPVSEDEFSTSATESEIIDALNSNSVFSKFAWANTYSGGSSSYANILIVSQLIDGNNDVNVNWSDFTTAEYDGYSAIYKISNYASRTTETTAPTLIYSDQNSTTKLNFGNNLLSTYGRYESSNLSKLYWSNGENPLRVLKLNQTYPSGYEADLFDYIPNVDFGSIDLELIDGGNLKAGVVQYAYQYYIQNGPATTWSQPSKFISISDSSWDKFSGGDVGDYVNKSVFLTINNLDSSFSRIRIISMLYEELDSDPEINIIAELEYKASDTSVDIIDNGTSLGTVSLAEFRTFAQTTYIPNTIESKDNILFAANITEDTFVSSIIENWDSRAYSFNGYGVSAAGIYNTPVGDDVNDPKYMLSPTGNWAYYENNTLVNNGTDWDIPDTFNCVNRDNSLYDNSLSLPTFAFNPGIDGSSTTYYVKDEYDTDSYVFGGKGKNIEYCFKWYQKNSFEADEYISQEDSSVISLLECMPNEVYRIGIVFFNSKGQNSFVKWISDIRWPYSGFKVDYYTVYAPVLEVTINTFPSDSDIAGYKIVRVNVTNADKTIKTNGLIAPTYGETSVFNTHAYISGYGETDQAMPSVSLISGNLALSTGTLAKQIVEFISPEMQFNNAHKSTIINDGRLIVNNYSDVFQNVSASATNFSSFLTTRSVDSLFNNSNYNSTSSNSVYNIEDYTSVSVDHVSETSDPVEYTLDNSYVYANIFLPNNTTCVASRASGLILKLTTDITIAYTDYTDSEDHFLIGSIIEDKDITRYGGYSNSSKRNNEYVDFSPIVNSTTSGSSVYCTFGNCYRAAFKMRRSLYYWETSTTPAYSGSGYQNITLYLPSYIDSRNRSDNIDRYTDYKYLQETVSDGVTLYPEFYNEDIGDLYIYNNVYSQNSSSSRYIPEQIDYDSSETNIVKILASNTKSNGEVLDSWTNFYDTNFIEVDGQYGNIIKLLYFKNVLYCFQENAISVLSVNQRSLINDNNVDSLALGNGGILDRYDYISFYSGIKSQYDVIKSKKDIYYIDQDSKRIYTVSSPNNSISEISGIHSLLSQYIEKNQGRKIGFDVDFNEIVFSIGDLTLSYNENTQSFVSRYSYIPSAFINTPEGLFSNKVDGAYDLNSYIYKHNYGTKGLFYSGIYGSTPSTSKVTLIINPNGNMVDVFDVNELRTEIFESGENLPSYNTISDETVDRIIYQNTYIDPITITLVDEKIKPLVKKWRAQVPLTDNSNRFVDTYLMVTLEFDNNNDKLFKLHDVITYFRPVKN